MFNTNLLDYRKKRGVKNFLQKIDAKQMIRTEKLLQILSRSLPNGHVHPGGQNNDPALQLCVIPISCDIAFNR